MAVSAVVTPNLQQTSFELDVQETGPTLRNPISADNKQLPVHRWVNWIAGFSAGFAGHAIDTYLQAEAGRAQGVVLDPFAGVGTTLVEAQRRGFDCIGFEINPFPHLASRAKLEIAAVDITAFQDLSHRFRSRMRIMEFAIDSLPPDEVPPIRRQVPPGFRSKVPFFSEKVQQKVLAALDFIDEIEDESLADLFRLAFATTMVSFSNYSYEPSLASRPGSGKPLVDNADVAAIVFDKLNQMQSDMDAYQRELAMLQCRPTFQLHLESFLTGAGRLPPGSVDVVVTSPPYLNNYHYVRNTRPHLFWLDFIASPSELKALETSNFGKFWQTVREGQPIHLSFSAPALEALIARLRGTNQHKGTYGGEGWANYASSYFNDSYSLFGELERLLRPGGTAIVIVGNNVLQGIEFKVDEHMVDIARSLGLEARTEVIRAQRVGSSIMGTGLRSKVSQPLRLYEAAVIAEKH